MMVGKVLTVVALTALLAGCAATSDETTQTAEQTAASDISDSFPGIDVDAAGNCVRDNATDAELVILAAGGDAAARMTASILARPATAECLAANGVDLRAAGAGA